MQIKKYVRNLKFGIKNGHTLIKNNTISLGLRWLKKKITFPFDYRFRKGYSSPPFSLHVGVTDICNLNCKMCFYANTYSEYSKLNNQGMMDLELFKKLIREVKGKPMIILTGGEPLLHPQIEEFVKEVKEQGMFCSMSTNSTLLKEKAKKLVDAGLDFVILSLDGTEEINDSIRGVKGTFKNVIEGAKELSKYKNRPLMGFNFAVSNLNYLNMEEFVKEMEKLDVHFINFNMLWQRTSKMVENHNRVYPEFKVSAVDYKYDNKKIDYDKFVENINWIKNKNSDKIISFFPTLKYNELVDYYEKPEKFLNMHVASCPWINAHVSPNGDVSLCGDIVFGNIKEDNINDIWNNKKFRDFRQKIKKNKAFPICARCCGFFEFSFST